MTNNFTPAKAGQHSKRLSKEEYAEKMKAEKEAVYRMADDTAKAIVSDPEKFKAFLDKRDVGDSVAVAQCVAQELGHAQLSINSDSYSRSDMGFQAVCIGYMLCKKYGIDTQNFAINRIPVKLANKEPKDIRYELSKTRNAMADIHSRVSDELYKKKQARSKDYER